MEKEESNRDRFKRKIGTRDPESFYRFLDNLIGVETAKKIIRVKKGI